MDGIEDGASVSDASLNSENGDNISFNLLIAQLTEKDKIIAQLQSQISVLSNQIAEQTKMISQLGDSFNDSRSSSKRPADVMLNTTANIGLAQQQTIHDSTPTPNAKLPRGIIHNPTLPSNPNNKAKVNNGRVSFAEATATGAKTMPIQLGTMNDATFTKLVDMISSNVGETNFKILKLNSDSPAKIYPSNADIKKRLVDVLTANQIEFNTFAEKGEKRQSFIIRGLNYGDDTSNIASINEVLRNIGITDDIDIERFVTSQMKRDNQTKSKLYRFTLSSAANISNLAKIDSIRGFRVFIEKMRKSTVIQCRRCQRFQHTAGSCAFAYRCVQCLTNHLPGNCPRHANPNLPVACCNCSAAGIKNINHTANNFGECSFFQQKHSILFNKYKKAAAARIEKFKSRDNNMPSNTSNSSRPVSSSIATSTATKNGIQVSDTMIGPTRANGSNKSTASSNKSGKNKKKRSSNRVNNIVNSGKSHTERGFPNDKLNALAGALAAALRQFL